jgi:hypothetical protein
MVGHEESVDFGEEGERGRMGSCRLDIIGNNVPLERPDRFS